MITLATAPADQPTINVELAEYSELFMLIAAFIYTLAFILFTIDAARSSATIRRVEAELAEEQAAERQSSLVAAGAATPRPRRRTCRTSPRWTTSWSTTTWPTPARAVRSPTLRWH